MWDRLGGCGMGRGGWHDEGLEVPVLSSQRTGGAGRECLWGWASPSAYARWGVCARKGPCGFGGDIFLCEQRKKVEEQSGPNPSGLIF